MTSSQRLTGLVAATHTPFHLDGSLNLGGVEDQCRHLLSKGVKYAFIGGTTGESSSLTLQERLDLAPRWMEVSQGTELHVIVHVGTNCVSDARTLATQAQELGAFAVSAVAPSYFKPPHVKALVETMGAIAGAAPELPFYYYEIPSMTGLGLSPSEFLDQAAEVIPNLAGLKFTSSNLMEYQLCADHAEKRFDVPFGFDEMLLAALALGAKGAVGSSFNFAAPIYHRVIDAFVEGDLERARAEQMKSVWVIKVLAGYGYMAAAKETMRLLGVDVGEPRLPCAKLRAEQKGKLKADLEALGFFDWVS